MPPEEPRPVIPGDRPLPSAVQVLEGIDAVKRILSELTKRL